MRVCVFVGPSLSAGHPVMAAEIIRLAPVQQGDVYRAVRRGARIVGIIDGYFEGVLSVWHKEILWAISEGVQVVGGASMGALRAAELAAFGMRGVGRIFADYRDGKLQDDDEVAVLHGPPELDFKPLCEAMVNIRATLDRAVAEGVVDERLRRLLTECAKTLFYQQRDWPRILQDARGTGCEAASLRKLEAWLPGGRVDLKRLDALEVVRTLEELATSPLTASAPGFAFEWTEMWDEVVAAGGGVTLDSATGNAQEVPESLLVEELQIEPGGWPLVRDQALLALVADQAARGDVAAPDEEARGRELSDLRRELGLMTRDQLQTWLGAHHLDGVGLRRILDDRIRLTGLRKHAREALYERILDCLRLSGRYQALLERATSKFALLSASGQLEPDPDRIGVSPAILLAWHFEQRMQCEIPEDIDRAARELGFEHATGLYRALLREWLYCQQTVEPGAGRIES